MYPPNDPAPQPRDLSPVGASARAPKSQTRPQVFDNRATIERVDDGTVIVSASFKYADQRGRDDGSGSFCPDKRSTHESWGEATRYIASLGGEAEPADAGPPPDAPPPEAMGAGPMRG